MTKSTIETSETITWEDGSDYPFIYKIEVKLLESSPVLHCKKMEC